MGDFKTPLSKVRGLGSAKDGTHHWWVQRVTAVANIPLVLFMIVSAVGNAGKGHADWVAWMAQPVVAVVVILFVANLMYHLRLGLQVTIEDYVHTASTKVALMLLLTFAVIAMAALSIFSVLRIAFGG